MVLRMASEGSVGSVWLQDKELFPIVEEMCGNRYLAIKFISSYSRRLSDKLPKWIIESRLMSWALTGEDPDISKYVNVNVDPDLRDMEDMLCYISDPNIQHCVRNSYIQSIRHHHLLYVYKKSMDEYDRARIRVIVRILWYMTSRRTIYE